MVSARLRTPPLPCPVRLAATAGTGCICYRWHAAALRGSPGVSRWHATSHLRNGPKASVYRGMWCPERDIGTGKKSQMKIEEKKNREKRRRYFGLFESFLSVGKRERQAHFTPSSMGARAMALSAPGLCRASCRVLFVALVAGCRVYPCVGLAT